MPYTRSRLLNAVLADRRLPCLLACISGISLFIAGPLSVAQDDLSADSKVAAEPIAESETEKQERVAAERFLELLKKRPRTGTALDKVYGYHIQNGTLDKFCDTLRSEATEKNSGESWMLLGMVQMQRGQDAEARVALERAEELLPKEPMVSYYLGKTLVLVGDVDKAAAALERSIERKPAKADMLQIFQELGRLYQRMRRSEHAIAVWNRMEKFFPGDAQVQEQIAIVLAEEGANAEALERFEKLAKTTKDRFRQVEMAMRAAQLKENIGRRDEALADFEKLLGQVNPDSWIYQDLRTRIDNVFLTRNDYDGLADYYTSWMEKHPDDIDAMLRIGRLLSVQRRTPEAKAWFSKAIERAPTEAAPRLALVDALERDRAFGPAAEAMKALAEIQSDNPDTIVRWGELIFSNQAIPEAQRAKEAGEVWKRLLQKRGDDPVTVARVADLLRGANLTDDAIATYRQAIALAENEPQYREYLGEYLFRLDRKEEALTVWREIASGPRENRENLVRLSEVLATFQLRDEALATMERVCDDKPTFGQRTRFAEMLRDATKYEDALKQLELAAALAESPEEESLVIEEQIKNFQANDKLVERIAELERATSTTEKDSAKSWELLARYQEADRKFQQAAESIKRAAELDSKSVAVQTIAVRVQEKAGMFGDAVETLRKLTMLDRRYLSNYLTQIASLQMRLGQVEDALKTGQELVSATSANSEQYRFYADLCFQAGKTDLGLDALRRNVRSNPNDRDAMRDLARNLANQFMTEEATELYWRSYSTASTLEEKRADVESMTELYLRTNRFEQLVTRLMTIGREENRQREATLLVAAAHQAAGDLGASRSLLEPLLREESRDADLLATLIKLAQVEFDWEAAANYQKRLNEVAPSPEGDFQLSRFYLEQGEIAQAQAIWAKLASRVATIENVTQTLEKLLARGENDKAVELAEQSLAREPTNWEIMSTVMTALWRADKRDRAAELAKQLLEMPVSFDTKSELARKQEAQAARSNANMTTNASTSASASAAARMTARTRSSWLSRLSQNSRLFVSGNDLYSSMRVASTRSPTIVYCFGDAKAIAMAIDYGAALAKSPNSQLSVEAITEQALMSDQAEVLWEALARVQLATQANAVQMSATMSTSAKPAASAATQLSPRERLLMRLFELGDKEGGGLLLQTKYAARSQLLARYFDNSATTDEVKPLLADEFTLIEKLINQSPATQMNTSGNATYELWLSNEYQLAKDEAKAESHYANAVKFAESNPAGYSEFLQRDRKFAAELFIRYMERQLQSSASGGSSYYSTATFVQQLIDASQESTEFVGLLGGLKKVQVGKARTLRPSQLVSYNPSQTLNTNIGMSTRTGGPSRVLRLQVDFPASSSLQSMDLLIAMRLLRQSTNQELKKAIASQLEADANSPDEEVLQSAVDRLCYASWLWWEDARAAAIEQMREYRKLNVATELGVVIESRMLFETNQFDAALTMLEGLKPMNQQMLQDRELAILQLLLQKGDITRAKQSAERLFALRLDTRTQMQVGDLMSQLGMREMSDAILQRVRQRSGSDLNSQHTLMQKLEAAGNKVAAVEIARQFLRRTQPSASTSVRTIDDSYRRTAVRVLVGAGEAKAMIESLEKRLEKSPSSSMLIRQLAELYEATGKRKEAQEVLAKLAKTTSNDPVSLLAIARTLQTSGKHPEAIEAFLKALEKQPELLNNEYYNMRNSLREGKQWKALVEGIERIGISRFRQSYRMVEIIRELGQVNEDEVAKRFFKSWMRETGASAVFEMAGRLGAELGASKVVDDDAAKMIVDSLITSFKSDPAGASLAQSRSLSGDGRTLTVLSLLGPLLKEREAEYQRILKEVRSLSDQHPQMRIVEAALVATRDVARLDELLPAIADDVKKPNSIVLGSVWPLASTLAHDAKHYQRAIDLLEPVCDKATDRNSGNGVDYSPHGLLIYCYLQTKDNAKAKAILDEYIANPQIDKNTALSNPGYGDYQLVQMRMAGAQKYLTMKYPIDALRTAISLQADRAAFERASTWSGNMEYMQQQLKRTEEEARKQITPELLAKLLTEELAVNQADKLQSAILPSLIDVKFEDKAGKNEASCLLTQFLNAVPKGAGGEAAIRECLTAALEVPLADRSVAQLHALACLAIRVDNEAAFRRIAKEFVAHKSLLNSESPPDTSEETKVANKQASATEPSMAAKLEQQAAIARIEHVALWISIQKLQALGENAEAEQLASLAMAAEGKDGVAAKRMSLQVARLQLASGEKGKAEVTLTAMLDQLSPKNEVQKLQNVVAGGDQAATLELTFDLAKAAADAELFDLSMEAVKRACANEQPLVKPQIESSLLGGQSANAMFRQVNAQPNASTQNATWIAAQVFEVFDKWKSKNVPTESIATTLEDVLLPAERPGSLRLMANEIVPNANTYSYEFTFEAPKPTRVLAFDLVDVASEMKTLPSLVERLEKYVAVPTTNVDAAILMAYAKRCLGKPDEAVAAATKVVESQVPRESVMALYSAMTRKTADLSSSPPIATDIPLDKRGELLSQLVKQHFGHNGIRAAFMQELQRCVVEDDEEAIEKQIAIVSEAIQQLPNFDQESARYLQNAFYQSLLVECRKQKKPRLVTEIASRLATEMSENNPNSMLDASTLLSIAELPPDQRMKPLRNVLLKLPLVKISQFSFSKRPAATTIPKFFVAEETTDKLQILMPYESSQCISALDALLNLADADKSEQAIVQELFANATENEDVRKFLAVWLCLRNEKRGKPVDQELTSLSTFKSDEEYISWWKTLPAAVASELVLHRIGNNSASEELLTAFEAKFSKATQSPEARQLRIQKLLKSDKSFTPADKLKHWIATSETYNWQAGFEANPQWVINAEHDFQFVGGAWSSHLLFRYPLPNDSKIEFKSSVKDKKTGGVFSGGIALASGQSGDYFASAPGGRSIGQINIGELSEENPLKLEATFGENSVAITLNGEKVNVEQQSATSVPFLGFNNYLANECEFSDIQVSAPVAIPREVDLLDESLTGWSAQWLGHAVPALKASLNVGTSSKVTIEPIDVEFAEDEPTPTKWTYIENELRAGNPSAARDNANKVTNDDADHAHSHDADSDTDTDIVTRQSMLGYARPLCEGEKVEFEFFHVTKSNNAAPVIGKMAYLIRNGKVKLHWIVTPMDLRTSDITVSNQADDPNAEVLAPVVLEDQAWTRAAIRLEGGKLVLAIGGTDVYRRQIEEKGPVQFGFFCDPSKDSVRIRNVVLSGDWPTDIPTDLWESN